MITYKELWYNQCLDFCHGTINYSPYMVVINKSNFNDIHVQHVYNDMYNMVSEILPTNSVIDRR
jgi:hypothetical protein